MDQDTAINKQMFWLTTDEIIKPDHINKMREILGQVYAAGYDEGRKFGRHDIRVSQYDMDWHYIRTFENITVAARSVRRDKSALSRAVKGKTKHCGGYHWRYANEQIKDIL